MKLAKKDRLETRWAKKKRQVKKERKKVEASRKVDFSKKAVDKAVAKETSQKPYVVFPAAVGLAAGAAALLFGGGSVLMATAATGAFVGLGSWIFNMTLRKQVHVADYLYRMNRILASHTQRSIGELREELQRVDEQQGFKQIELLQNKYSAFNEILENKFNKGEITFNRYHAMVEQVFLAVLDNLKQITNIKQSINVIDENHINDRIQALKSGRMNSSREQELDALIGRYRLLQKQRDMVQTKLAQNESAMTKMDEVMAAVSVINPTNSRASMDMEDAMKELEALAKRASSYSAS